MTFPPMRRVALIRHLKADWASDGSGDIDRPLAARGVQDAAALKAWLQTRIAHFDLVLCSPAKRTMQTMFLLGLAEAHRPVRELYNAPAATIIDTLAKADAAATIGIIGHNPGIGDAAAKLVATPPDHSRFDDYPTGATLILEWPADQPIQPGEGQLVDFAVPGDLAHS